MPRFTFALCRHFECTQVVSSYLSVRYSSTLKHGFELCISGRNRFNFFNQFCRSRYLNEAEQLREAVEKMLGGTATFSQFVPVRETFEGKPVWEGVVHVFQLAGHPTATRAYAWSSPQ